MRKHDPKIDRLLALPMFAACSRDSLKGLTALLDECSFQSGETMTVQGKPGLEFFVIESGIADVSIDGRRVATLGPGDCVGETAMLDNMPRTATVTARGTVTAFVASVSSFPRMIKEHPDVAASMLRQMASRLRVATGTTAG